MAKRLNVKVEEAQDVILAFEDLLMKTVAFHGIECSSVPEMLVAWAKLKSDLKWKVEEGLNHEYDTIQPVSPSKEYNRLNIKSTKKYTF